jgi:hypothetical protein
MNENEQLVARVQRVQAEGEEKYGTDRWGTYISAISRANPQGIPDQAWGPILDRPDACDVIAAGGREALITMATNGDREADRTYSQMREKERKEFRLLRGRGPA